MGDPAATQLPTATPRRAPLRWSAPHHRPHLQDASAIAWLTRLRWIAIVAVAVSLVLGHGLGWMTDLWKPALAVLGLAAFNSWSWRISRSGGTAGGAPARSWDNTLLLNVHVDLAALTAILYWTGGVENPFSSFYVFPVAIASILLAPRRALLVFASAFALLLLLVGLAPAGAVLAGTTAALHAHPTYITALCVARGLTLLGIVFFLTSLVSRLRRAEEQRRSHELIAQSRERLARVGAISAGLSHSIRNPLHGALNCVTYLAEDPSPEERKECVQLLEEGLRRIESVTHRLMLMTRDAPFRPEPVDLGEMIPRLLMPLQLRNDKDRPVRIETEIGAVPPVVIDPNRVHEALFNVVANAIDALPETGGRVVISAQPIDEPFAGVRIEVRDTGSGIAPHDLAHVFDPFFTTKPIGEGTGLGLCITRREVEEHGGEVEVSSVLGEGTSVRILLPLHPARRE